MNATGCASNIAVSDAPLFSESEKKAVYRAIFERRDMRHFSGGQVADEQLLRLLNAAHHAPSVGLMQPWRFIRIRDAELKAQIHALVEQERIETARALGEREDEFMRLKVQGVLDAAEVLVVALPPGRDKHVFGRRTMPQMDLASASCAIQNLWLAARAENLGMGWVSIFCPIALAQLLRMPPASQPIAILCLGPVDAFYDQPMLQAEKWSNPQDLTSMVFEDRWDQAAK
jgi:5,6-dimethylbenzimidazole synthase